MFHDARQVAEVAPEAVEVFGRAIDEKRLLDMDAILDHVVAVIPLLAAILLSRVEPQLRVERAVAADTALDHGRTDAGDQQAGNAPAADAQQGQDRSGRDGNGPFALPDVHLPRFGLPMVPLLTRRTASLRSCAGACLSLHFVE